MGRLRLVAAAIFLVGCCGCKNHQSTVVKAANASDNQVMLTDTPLRVSPGVNPDVWGDELKLTISQREQAVNARNESNRLYAERMDALKAGRTAEEVKPLLDKQLAAQNSGLDFLSEAQKRRLFQLQLQRDMLHAAATHRDFVKELGLSEAQLKAIAIIRIQHGQVQADLWREQATQEKEHWSTLPPGHLTPAALATFSAEVKRMSRAYQLAHIKDRKAEEQEEEADLTPAQCARWRAMLGPIFVEKPLEPPKPRPQRRATSPRG